MRRYNLILESDAGTDKFTRLSINTYKKNLSATPEQAKANSQKLMRDLKVTDQSILSVLANQIARVPSYIGEIFRGIFNKVKKVLTTVLAYVALGAIGLVIWVVATLFLFYFKVKMKFSRDTAFDEATIPNVVITEKDVESAWKDVLNRYISKYDINLSYMSWNFSVSPRSKDGSIVDEPSNTSAGSWTSKKIVFLNPRMIEVFNHYKPNSVKSKRKLMSMLRYVIAHELAYEVWSNKKTYSSVIQTGVKNAGVGMVDTISKKPMRSKADMFAGYMANTLVPDCFVEGIELNEAIFNSDYIRSFISYAYDNVIEFTGKGLDYLEDRFGIPRKAVGVVCFLVSMLYLFTHL